METFTKPLEYAAATLLDGVTGLLSAESTPLRGAPSDGRVTLPDDLFAKADVQTEWWYYTGHGETNGGRVFGFELCFFKRRTDLDRIGVVPVAIVANPMYFAHFAISDITAQKFRYEHIRSFGGAFDMPVSMSTTACDVRLGEWSLREVAGKHILRATLEDGLVFDAILTPSKPLVLNGEEGSGIALKSGGGSNHFSFTRMAVSGQLNENGQNEQFTGTAWMDREFGIRGPGAWDWFSIQFDDNTELMIYQFAAPDGSKRGDSTGTFVAEDGTCKYLVRRDFDIEELATWTSPHTGAECPARWKVTVESLGVHVELRPLLADQELITRGTTMINYWEGACQVTGTREGKPVGGKAYVELVGYDRSHEKIGMADFLFGTHQETIRSLLP